MLTMDGSSSSRPNACISFGVQCHLNWLAWLIRELLYAPTLHAGDRDEIHAHYVGDVS